MKLRKIVVGFPVLFFGMIISSCEPGDQEIKKLNRNDGIWTITDMHYEYFDSVGVNVASDSTVSDVGELVFFTSQSADALYSGYTVVANMNQSNGTVLAVPGYIFYDSKRVYMQDSNASGTFPTEFQGVWTVDENKRNKQSWTQYYMDPNTGYLSARTTIHLTKK